jgi:hypothetical protein
MLTELKTLEPVMKSKVEYKGIPVVPSQWYAEFCGKEVKYVNRALKRLTEQERLIEENDYFKLTAEMVPAGNHILNELCDPKYGIYLLTLKSVNTLSHYFDDPKSVELSIEVNERATEQMEEEYTNDPLTKSILDTLALRKRQLKMEKQINVIEDKIDKIDNSIISIQGRLPNPVSKEYLFPQGCITRANIRANYFFGISEENFVQFLKAINWPTKPHTHIDDNNVVHTNPVFVEEGLDSAYEKLLLESRFEGETPLFFKMHHPHLSMYYIRKSDFRASHISMINKEGCVDTYRAKKEEKAIKPKKKNNRGA